MPTHFWARYSSRIELNLEADCDAVIDSCRFPTSATEEGAEDVAARRRDDETMVGIIVVVCSIECSAAVLGSAFRML
jgi:hypothetical protein